jgi:hypothetical protein
MVGRKGAIRKNRPMVARHWREPVKLAFVKLAAADVPKDKMPSNDRILGMMPSWIDDRKMGAWVERFVRNRVALKSAKKKTR